MAFDYSDLNGIIIKVFGTQAKFAVAMGLSEHTISLKLNSKVDWKKEEMAKACDKLGIPLTEIHNYFFKPKVQD